MGGDACIGTHGLVAMTSASDAEGRQCDLGLVYIVFVAWVNATPSVRLRRACTEGPELGEEAVSRIFSCTAAFLPTTIQGGKLVNIWPRGPMDKASAYGAGDCRFESCRGHLLTCVKLSFPCVVVC